MKRCPSCQRAYDDTQNYCFDDATPLVRDSATNDLAKTLVINPPPPPVYQTYQPQQQWSPPVGRQGVSSKVFICAIAGLVLVVGLSIYFLKRSGSSSASTYHGSFSSISAGTGIPPVYEGSLADLMPESVGNFKKESQETPPPPAEFRKFDPKASIQAMYRSSNGQLVRVRAINFGDRGDAGGAFSQIKDQFEAAEKSSGRFSGPTPTFNPRSKDGSNGNRWEICDYQPGGRCFKKLLLTNGSVMFAISGNENDALDFEKNFPY